MVGPKSNDSCPCSKKRGQGHRDLHGRRTPSEDWGKDWRVASTNQRMPTTAGNESLEERPGTDSASESQKKPVIPMPLFLDFKPAALGENKHLLFWATQFLVIYYGTPIKLMWFPIIFITKIPQTSLTFGQVKSHVGSNNSNLIEIYSHFLMQGTQSLWKDFPFLTIQTLYSGHLQGEFPVCAQIVCPQ